MAVKKSSGGRKGGGESGLPPLIPFPGAGPRKRSPAELSEILKRLEESDGLPTPAESIVAGKLSGQVFGNGDAPLNPLYVTAVKTIKRQMDKSDVEELLQKCSEACQVNSVSEKEVKTLAAHLLDGILYDVAQKNNLTEWPESRQKREAITTDILGLIDRCMERQSSPQAKHRLRITFGDERDDTPRGR